MGWVVENSSLPRLSTLFLGGIAACTVQMGMGVWMLAQFFGWTSAWTLGLLPFLPGEILKIIAVCLASPSISNQNPLSLNLLHHHKS